jgi:hypothetical protein
VGGGTDQRAQGGGERKREGKWEWAGAGMLGWNRKWAGGDEVGPRGPKGEGGEGWGGLGFFLIIFFKLLFLFFSNLFKLKILKLNSFPTFQDFENILKLHTNKQKHHAFKS